MAEMGRPLIYKTVHEMQKAIDQFFDDCAGTMLTDKDTGEPVLNKYDEPIYLGAKPPTVTGLALALGFNSRQALLNYQDRPEFNDAVTRAKARCQAYAESRLFDRDGSNGAKFSLQNNFGWADKQEIEYTGANGGPIQVQAVQTMSDEQLRQVIEIMEQNKPLLPD